jgi:DNA-directed RNA polymerase
MMITVLRCRDRGVRAFSCVHDSYAVHAGKADILGEELRIAFCDIYADDILEDFKAQLEAQLPEGVELPPLPSKGKLDISGVIESEYFFA